MTVQIVVVRIVTPYSLLSGYKAPLPTAVFLRMAVFVAVAVLCWQEYRVPEKGHFSQNFRFSLMSCFMQECFIDSLGYLVYNLSS
jgi:hypothetical protein